MAKNAPKADAADPAEIRKDAEALVRIFDSPRIPSHVKHVLGEALDPYMDEHRDADVGMMAALLAAIIREGGAR